MVVSLFVLFATGKTSARVGHPPEASEFGVDVQIEARDRRPACVRDDAGHRRRRRQADHDLCTSRRDPAHEPARDIRGSLFTSKKTFSTLPLASLSKKCAA